VPLTILSDGWNVILALLGFTFVIFIHELGHFLFAKWAGVRVERFSIGFGPVVWSRKLGETEYAISLLPLGGYVKMLGEEDGEEGKVDPRSFANASRPWRGLILIGGVLFNLLSSYAILLALAWYGMPLAPPVVGGVLDEMPTYDKATQKMIYVESPAKRLGLRLGDRIKTINGERIYSLDDVIFTVMTHGTRPLQLTIQRPGEAAELTLPADDEAIIPVYSVDDGRPGLGILFPRGRRVQLIASTNPIGADDPQPGERLVAINGDRLPDELIGQQIEDRLLRHLGKSVTLTLERKNKTRDVVIQYAGDPTRNPGLIGFPVRIAMVSKDSPAQAAGLVTGDIVVSVDGEAIRSTNQILALLRTSADRDAEVKLTVLREGAELGVIVRAREIDGRKIIGIVPDEIDDGYLPYLPPGIDAKPNPLVAAGVKVGDTILKVEADPAAKGERQLVTVLSGGSVIDVPVSEQQLKDVSLQMREKEGSALSKLLGKKVVAIVDHEQAPIIETVDSEGKTTRIALAGMDAELRASLLAELRPDDWVTTLSILPHGARGIEILRGADGVPRVLPIDLRQPGLALGLDFEERRIQANNFGEAMALANNSAYNAIWRTLQIIPRFFRKATEGGISSSKSLHGPIGIFTALKMSYERWGFASFLKLVAVIGLNLFLVNLLPIPVVDGGQLVFLGLEAILRRPVPALVKTIAGSIGIAIIVSLMLYVVSLDILRKIGWL
jgi:regulator of sigma E protease